MVYLLEDESLGSGCGSLVGNCGSLVGNCGSLVGNCGSLMGDTEPPYIQEHEPSLPHYPSPTPQLPPSPIPLDTPCTPQQLVTSLADRIPILANTYMFGFQTEEDALYLFEDTEDSPVLIALTTVTCALIDRLGDTFHSQIWEVRDSALSFLVPPLTAAVPRPFGSLPRSGLP